MVMQLDYKDFRPIRNMLALGRKQGRMRMRSLE